MPRGSMPDSNQRYLGQSAGAFGGPIRPSSCQNGGLIGTRQELAPVGGCRLASGG
jgi:hypothetical protein